ncbi:hypothetical protein [Streptomyces scabiei]|uniref:hypothetical protein n=1 Tax=Streptomyces scabiei TaxID=1930 RepID=UPI0029B91269|nr:hypothetical protein [Streptomyces scabiei]MDX2531611.1 hypothetical protein [Streptomyces scabiei]MDX2796669.1 hypothetical protein [Streptomyces scabiei]MDX2858938.1 hypothetical protein [Streptomyces scabiei]MDX3824543.1 hypothetical protein [Streptomyces scabiei]
MNAALRQVWEQEGGKRPDPVRLRYEFLLATMEGEEHVPAPMSLLLNPRGIALRFYLLALFEAQCRLDMGAEWASTRPLGGAMGWRDFVAIDAAYDSTTGHYLRKTKQGRKLDSSRLRQVQGSLRTFEDMDRQALVEVPRKENGQHRDYGEFVLMQEKGRGELPTANRYRVPTLSELTVDIPRDFFLHGWVSVLYPTEIATWLALRLLAKHFPGRHDESGVYLYGEDREQWFGLRRDAYEDSCAMLLDIGLIRPAQRRTPPSEAAPVATDFNTLLASIDFSQPSQPNRYEAHRYQLTDEGLREDALEVCLREVVHRRNESN